MIVLADGPRFPGQARRAFLDRFAREIDAEAGLVPDTDAAGRAPRRPISQRVLQVHAEFTTGGGADDGSSASPILTGTPAAVTSRVNASSSGESRG